jgi:hypothetical protein
MASEIAYSCTCVPGTHKKEIERTDVIFTGKVVEIIEDTSYVPAKTANALPALPQQLKTDTRYFVKFKIETGFKGVADDGEITLVQYEYEKLPPCAGMFFTRGNKYLVYAAKYKNELRGDRGCSRTRHFDRKSKDYKELLQFGLKSKKKKVS